jgi:hypothetical protein
MEHGKCCDCFVCKLGKSLGLMEDCKCETKKTVKKSGKKVAKKKKVVKK